MKALRKNNTGSVAVEAAFTVGLLAVVSFGMLEMLLVSLSANIVENAVNETAREGITGYVPVGSTRTEYLEQRVAEKIDAFLDGANLSITMRAYDEADQIGKAEVFEDGTNGFAKNDLYDEGENYTDTNKNGQWDADMGLLGAGDQEKIVLYRAEYRWRLLTPLLSSFIGEDGVITLHSSILVKNEPFGS